MKYYWRKSLTVRFLFAALLSVIFVNSAVIGQQKSKVTGIVKDAQTREPLIGANVIIVGTRLGAATDMEGRFHIINVPVGYQTVQATMTGYAKQIVQNVLVSADRFATVNFDLASSQYQSKEVVVVAERNELHKEVSNTQIVVTSEQLASTAGIREVNVFLQKQPGISSSNGYLEIRGGSADQTGTLVNGLAYNNATNGNSETNIPMSAIDQISLLSGGFNAEYGNFRSGLINVTTKSGSKSQYHGTISGSFNIPHLKRFGPAMSDPHSPALAPYMDARYAFGGVGNGLSGNPDSAYLAQQMDAFTGWIDQAKKYNVGKGPKDTCSAMDLYLLNAWMHMAKPDYEGLAKLGYTVSDQQKKLFDEHAWNEEGTDYNIDAGFGGPVIPFMDDPGFDWTFYLSHTTREKHYIIPVSRSSEESHVSLLTTKLSWDPALTFTTNFLWKTQHGMSQIRPAFGDFPDASRNGGFMPMDNLKLFTRVLDNIPTGYWYDPELFARLDESTIMAGLNTNYVLSPQTYLESSLSYLSIRDASPTGDNRDQTVLTHFGPFPVSEMPYGKMQFTGTNRLTIIDGLDTITFKYPSYDGVYGISTRRFRGKEGDLYNNIHTQQWRAKFDLVSQMSGHHYFKAGFEYNLIDIDHKFWEKWNNNAYNTYEYNYHRKPSQTGLYLQDQITYEGIVANLGLRLDYFYGGGGKWPSGDPFSTAGFVNVPFRDVGSGAAADSFFTMLSQGRSLIWEYWEQYDRDHPGFLQPVKNYFSFSPRLGIAFPVTEYVKFYFNYGHFRSNPPYYSMYLLRYRYTKNGLYDMSNPNLEPPKTIQYEIGSTFAYEGYNVTLSGYYKDVTGQQGDINYTNAAGTINYSSWANNNYQDVRGLELNVSKSDNSWLTGWINFNYMAKKSGLTGRNTITDITINDDKAGLYAGNETRFLPLPSLNTNINIAVPDEIMNNETVNMLLGSWRIALFGEWSEGGYFTWNPLNKLHYSNNLQWPNYYMFDMRLSKTFAVAGVKTTFYVDINNLFNIKVSLLGQGYAFNKTNRDDANYLASLKLPMYDTDEYNDLRRLNNPSGFVPTDKNPGLYPRGGTDKVGDTRSSDKPYINDPNYSYFIYGQPRDIWFGLRIDF